MKKITNPVVCQTTGKVFDANDTTSRLNHFESDETIAKMIASHPPDVKARIKHWLKEDRNRDRNKDRNDKNKSSKKNASSSK